MKRLTGRPECSLRQLSVVELRRIAAYLLVGSGRGKVETHAAGDLLDEVNALSQSKVAPSAEAAEDYWNCDSAGSKREF
jgi:hypothetical protein